MRKYLGPVLVIALALLVAGAWVSFPQERKAIGPAISSFCSSFAAEAKTAWARLFPSASKPVVPDDGDPPSASGNAAPAVETELGAIADSKNDPEPASLTPAQRRQKYKELLSAADQRKREIMRANLMKSPEGQEALKATRAYHAKVEEMERLEEKYGQTDDRVTRIRIEIVALKEAVQVANIRYKIWKAAHSAEIADPLSDKLYNDLIARSRFYKD